MPLHRWRIRSFVVSLVASVAPVAACGGGDSVTPDARLPPECLEAPDHSDLDWLQTWVFTPSCSRGRDCHGPNTPALGLSLEIGDTEAGLIGQPSVRRPEEILVVPGDPDASYLMVVLGSREGDNPSGLMPPGITPLCQPIRAAVERWIAALPAP